MVEFLKREDIENWLNDKPREVSVAIAARAALRVLPLMNRARKAENFESAILLPVFHGTAIPAFAGTWPNAGMAIAATRAARAADAVYAADAAYAARAVDAAYAAYAARAVDAAYAADAARAAYAAAYAARAAADDARAAYAAVSKDAAFLVRFLDGDLEQGLLELTRTPLWPDHDLSLPEEISKNWRALKTHLLSREDENWQVWTDWYEDRLNGFASRDPKMELEKARIERLTDEDWKHKGNPSHLNGILAEIEAEFRRPEITAQSPGLQFGVSEAGRVEIAESGLPEDEEDKAEIEAFRDVLIETAEELKSHCAGSNMYGFIEPHVDQYILTLRKDIEHLSLDKLHAYGVILNRAYDRVKQDAEAGHLPETDAPIQIAFESLLALHGPTVSGTKRIQTILSRPNPLADDSFSVEKYIEAAQPVIQSATNTLEFLGDEAKDVLPELNNAVEGSSEPGRTVETTRTGNTNFLKLVSKVAVFGLGTSFAGIVATAVQQSVPGTLAISTITEGINLGAQAVQSLAVTCGRFLMANEANLRVLIAASGSDLSWLGPVLDWVRRQHNRFGG